MPAPDHNLPDAAVAMSVVIPAYNEAARLPPYLEAIRSHLDAEMAGDYEVIVVDDGSADGMAAMVTAATSDWAQLRLVRHAENQGKGAAVRTGMLAARGRRLLFADADGATPIVEERRLRAAIEGGADVAAGSRLIDGDGVVCRRSWSRGLVGRAFAAVAGWLLRLPVRDTQCGFKMFRGEAGRRLFPLVEEKGYLFDLELLILARRLGYRVLEVPVSWADQPGGRLSVVRESRRILAGLWRLRRRQAALEKREPALEATIPPENPHLT